MSKQRRDPLPVLPQYSGQSPPMQDSGSIPLSATSHPAAGLTVTAQPSRPPDIRLETAIEHLREMWADAIGPQIGGRRFFGEIRIRVPFMDGRAQDLFGEKEWRDRVAGGH